MQYFTLLKTLLIFETGLNWINLPKKKIDIQGIFHLKKEDTVYNIYVCFFTLQLIFQATDNYV